MNTTYDHKTITTQYHGLYASNVFERMMAEFAEDERKLHESIGTPGQHTLEEVRNVVAKWERDAPNSFMASTARMILNHREAQAARNIRATIELRQAHKRETQDQDPLAAFAA